MTSLYLPNTESVSNRLDRPVAAQQQRANWSRLPKRGFDILVAGLVTVTVLSWLIPIIVLLIKLTSKGPALFVQDRSGYGGRPFRCLKFRTMTHNPNAVFQQASKYDSRVTPLGRILRRTNLDELPQFINVLTGDMSIVGPRPHPLPLDSQYWHSMPGYWERYSVKPGITGLAQVRGARGETGQRHLMKQRVRYDHLYIQRQSISLDARICWWTVKAAMRGNPNAW